MRVYYTKYIMEMWEKSIVCKTRANGVALLVVFIFPQKKKRKKLPLKSHRGLNYNPPACSHYES